MIFHAGFLRTDTITRIDIFLKYERLDHLSARESYDHIGSSYGS